jgi:hypothetical protein
MAKISFITTCPQGHRPTLEFEAEHLRQQLDQGWVRLSCILCDSHWDASEMECLNARKLLRNG